MKFKVNIIVCLFVLFTISVQAEQIIFKDGTRIQGKVTDMQPDTIKVFVDHKIIEYPMKDVASIARDDQITGAFASLDPTQFAGISLNKLQLIATYLEINGTYEDAKVAIEQVLADAPPGKAEMFKTIFDINEIFAGLIPIYDKYFTEEDLEEMIKFFGSPTGKVFMENSPFVFAESANATVGYFRQKIAENSGK